MSFLSIAEEIELLSTPRVGEVIVEIAPNRRGRVEFEATTWNAEFYQAGYQNSVFRGDKVKVLARKGNTLLIMPSRTA
jgi:membrane protein implicated in regulation of membrane protease activity